MIQAHYLPLSQIPQSQIYYKFKTIKQESQETQKSLPLKKKPPIISLTIPGDIT